MKIIRKGKCIAIDDGVFKCLKDVRIGLTKRDTYVTFRRHGVLIYLHRYIMRCPQGKIVDHINGNTYDNRKSNLRICSNADNVRHRVRLNKNNQSGKCGVHYSTRERKWVARIKHKGKEITLGYYDDLVQAVKARQRAEEKLWKQFKPQV